MTAVHFTDLLPPDHTAASLRADALAGLTSTPKSLPPKWFYDKVGSELFEEITRLPEYYPTRAEREILQRRSREIVDLAGCDTLVELGSGSSEKTRLLLDALVGGVPDGGAYVALDVSREALLAAARGVAHDYPALRVCAVRADFGAHLEAVAGKGKRLVAFLGGTIGNFQPGERRRFLGELRAQLSPGSCLLLGADLVKDPDVLVRAYDDAAGVTAAFNRNVLEVLNRGLDAAFDPAAFRHVAVWDESECWIEMRLRSVRAQRVRVGALGIEVAFEDGEEMRTEISAKFRRETLAAELAGEGWHERGWWTDEAGRFSLSLWEV